jgi:hypothetical protein
MSFFEPPAPQPRDEVEPVSHPWAGPPNNVLGITLPVDVVLARSAKAVVTLGSILAYPEGFEFSYLILVRDPEVGERLPEMHHYRRRRGVAETGLADDLFRFGLEFADGSRVTTLEEYRGFAQPPDEIKGPVLIPRGGGGSLDRWYGSYWVWPLPSEGSLAFVCEWPVADLPLARYELDAAPIRDAASRAQVLWEGEAGSASAGHGSFSQQYVRSSRRPT